MFFCVSFAFLKAKKVLFLCFYVFSFQKKSGPLKKTEKTVDPLIIIIFAAHVKLTINITL